VTKAVVSPQKLLKRLRRYAKSIERLERSIDGITEIAEKLAEDVGDDLLFLEAEVHAKQPKH
jgi:hypothetical protein